MPSIENRISDLEASHRPVAHRILSDAERAVRIMHILNGPDRPGRAELVKFIETNAQPKGDPS